MKYFLISLLYFISLEIFSEEIIDVSNQNYLPHVLSEIKNSTSSIRGSFYLISLTDKTGPVFKILNALCSAKNRGVSVEIIIERGNDEKYYSIVKTNARAFSYLKRNDVNVFYDDKATRNHSKYWIFDEMSVIASSTNLSCAALTQNREAGLLIRSKKIAHSFKKEFDKIPRYSPDPVLDAIPIPRFWIRDPDIRPRLAPNSKVWRFIFWAYKKSFETNSKTIKFSGDESSDFFGSAKSVNKLSSDKYLRNQLYHWKEQYTWLIKDFKWDAKTGENKIILTHQAKARADAVYIPNLFFKDRWDLRLSVRAMMALLYVLDKTESGRMGNYFEQFQDSAEEEYGLTKKVLGYGLTDLQRWNLIEKEAFGGKTVLKPNGIILNKFYVYKDFKEKLEKLKNKISPELFDTVSKIADRINEPSDIEVIRELISFGKKYGNDFLKRILKIIPKTKNSRYRRWRYLRTVIQNQGEKEITP